MGIRKLTVKERELIEDIDEFCKKIIDEFYLDKSKIRYEFQCEQIIKAIKTNEGKRGQNKVYKFLDKIKDKKGIYCFVDSEGNPVYIGQGGSKKDDIKRRVIVEHKIYPEDTGATLTENIRKIEKLFGKNMNYEDARRLLFDYKVIVIAKNKNDSELTIESLNRIEQILIHLFRPNYNLDYSIT